jgi:hypothetical protein
MTSYVSGNVRRMGSTLTGFGTDFLVSDGPMNGSGSIRNETRYGGGPSAWRDYGPAQSAQNRVQQSAHSSLRYLVYRQSFSPP